MKDIYRHGITWWKALSLSRLFTRAIVLLLLWADNHPAALNSSCTASQPASQHKRARHCDDLPRPAFKVQFRLPGEATPHRNQPYCYWLFCPAFACALIWIGNPSDNSTSTFCQVFMDS
jgi:hypothetical protein